MNHPKTIKMPRAKYLALPEYDPDYAGSSPPGSTFRYWVHRNPDSNPKIATVLLPMSLHTVAVRHQFVDFTTPPFS